MINFYKSKLSLQDIFKKNLLNEVDKFHRKFVRKFGFLLVIPLSGAKEKVDKSKYDTLFIDKGYVTQAIPLHKNYITVPFLSSWGGIGFTTGDYGEMRFTEFNNFLEFERFKTEIDEDVEGIPINWKLRLDKKFLSILLNKDYSIDEEEIWNDFKKVLLTNSKVQIQMFVSLPEPNNYYNISYEGIETVKLEGGNTREFFTIVLPYRDIYSVKLVTQGKEYISYPNNQNNSANWERIVEEKEPVGDELLDAIIHEEIDTLKLYSISDFGVKVLR
ncbi:MAG: hypothetical protein KI793_29250 [Rivularia sp. (in: Bacteria)]|nr:hypothetical protein [Rivularia sp. MS3]